MRVLRLGTSNDALGKLPEAQRGWKIAERMLEEAIGEPVETVLRRSWPTAAYPALVERWVAEYRPDLMVLQINNFWYGHESIPLWFERRLGRIGRRLNRAGTKVGNAQWFADSPVAQQLNRRLLRILPGATHFTVEEVADCMEATMRRVLVHEGVVLVVRGNDNWAEFPMASRRFNRRNRARNAAMSSAMRSACLRLRVPYVERETMGAADLKGALNSARWHNSADGERQSGELDGQAMVAAWNEAHAPGPGRAR